ncbi:ABC transporter permease [Nitriliruptoraceae bacterium ZYF776]|nr:ABC transporter permease [Profundirhabdus halotolerans]
MGPFVARRFLQSIPVFFGATFLVFAMVFAIPGDPIQALAGERPLAEATVEVLRDRYNLNDPLLIQYLKYIGGVFTGDLGMSFSGREVTDILVQRFPVTLRLAGTAFVIEIVLGITAGILAGIRRGSFIDNLVLVSTTAVVSIPVFVLGYVAQLVIGLELGWLPISGINAGWQSYVLPGFVLAATSLAYAARLLRTSLVENLRADYVRTATSKGLRRSRVVGRHALRNSLIPVITFFGADLGVMMGGAIITEGIFNVPGVGSEVFRAVSAQEGPVVVGIVTALVIIFILSNLVVDLLYGVLDPRIRYE